MSTQKKILSLLAVPAAFVAAFALAFCLAFLVLGATNAFAQPAEQGSAGQEKGAQPAYGYAPPSDETPPPAADPFADKDAEKKRVGAEATGDDIKIDGHGTSPAGNNPADEHGEPAHDPTRTFNFVNFSYRGKDEYGGRFGDGKMVDANGNVVMEHGRAAEEEPMSAPFILMLLNFGILMAILIWKGKPAAQQLARDRHDQIKTALDEAAKLRKQAEDKLREYETRLKDADAEIRKLVEGIRTDAQADKARILDNAAKQSIAMKKDADLRIAAEIEAARARLTREVTAAAAVATEKLLREKLMPGDQQKLVSTFISDIRAEQPKGRA